MQVSRRDHEVRCVCTKEVAWGVKPWVTERRLGGTEDEDSAKPASWAAWCSCPTLSPAPPMEGLSVLILFYDHGESPTHSGPQLIVK